MLIRGLRHESISVRSRWERRTVATRRPVREEHDEHWMIFALESQTAFSAALILDDGHVSQFGRLPAGSASFRLTVRLSFMPFDWHESDAVDVGLYQDVTAFAGIFVKLGRHLCKGTGLTDQRKCTRQVLSPWMVPRYRRSKPSLTFGVSPTWSLVMHRFSSVTSRGPRRPLRDDAEEYVLHSDHEHRASVIASGLHLRVAQTLSRAARILTYVLRSSPISPGRYRHTSTPFPRLVPMEMIPPKTCSPMRLDRPADTPTPSLDTAQRIVGSPEQSGPDTAGSTKP
jgi:hypothetical protein